MSILKITQGGRHCQRTLTSNNPFFKSSVIIAYDHEHIRFTKPDLDSLEVPRKTAETKKDWFSVTITSPDLPFTIISFDDEESNEDELVAYFSDVVPG